MLKGMVGAVILGVNPPGTDNEPLLSLACEFNDSVL